MSKIDRNASTAFDLEAVFSTVCAELGLDPANTNHFEVECRRQGRDPRQTSAFDLDQRASDLWAAFRKLKRAG